MRAVIRLPLAVAACAVLGLVAPAPVTAGCAGPSLGVPGAEIRFAPEQESRSVVLLPRAQGPLVVTGEAFSDGTCNDTPSTSGCGSPEVRPTQPARGVELELTQAGRTFSLGTADAADEGGRYAVRWEVQLPGDVRPGRATLTAGTASLVVEVPAG